jgi:hypothetical protein
MTSTSTASKLSFSQMVLLGALFAMLVFAVVWASMAWTSADDVQMSVHGWIALALGTVFSIVFGCGSRLSPQSGQRLADIAVAVRSP